MMPAMRRRRPTMPNTQLCAVDVTETRQMQVQTNADFRENGRSMRIPERAWLFGTYSQQDRIRVLAASPAAIFGSFILRGIASRYVFATVKSRLAASVR